MPQDQQSSRFSGVDSWITDDPAAARGGHVAMDVYRVAVAGCEYLRLHHLVCADLSYPAEEFCAGGILDFSAHIRARLPLFVFVGLSQERITHRRRQD